MASEKREPTGEDLAGQKKGFFSRFVSEKELQA